MQTPIFPSTVPLTRERHDDRAFSFPIVNKSQQLVSWTVMHKDRDDVTISLAKVMEDVANKPDNVTVDQAITATVSEILNPSISSVEDIDEVVQLILKHFDTVTQDFMERMN
jgi:hypothetical protein